MSLANLLRHIYIIAPKGDVYNVVVIAKGYFIGCPILVNAVGIDQEVAKVCCSSSFEKGFCTAICEESWD
jgi:hypothetical protein